MPRYDKIPTRNEVILNWCKERRPDVVNHMEKILEREDAPIDFLIAIVFKAGRDFQHENPQVSIHEGV